MISMILFKFKVVPAEFVTVIVTVDPAVEWLHWLTVEPLGGSDESEKVVVTDGSPVGWLDGPLNPDEGVRVVVTDGPPAG